MFEILLIVAKWAAIGILWQLWLEWFTMRNLEGELGEPMTDFEKIFHVFFWPFTLGSFIYNFLKTLFGRNK